MSKNPQVNYNYYIFLKVLSGQKWLLEEKVFHNMCMRDRPRFFDQVGYLLIGNKHFFSK